nr:unnamed protein product [Callosobruchus analis]
MDERHTGTISTKFQAILEEWGIDHQKVHCMVCDRGSNMVRAMQLSGFEDISCAIHQIQLCIRAGVETQEWNSTFYMMERFSKLKDLLVLYLSANSIAMISPEDWMNIQKFVQLMQPFEEITRN